MNTSPTLTAAEFTKIHNGLHDLNLAINRLDGVINPDLMQVLARARNGIRSGLKSAYAQEDRSSKYKFQHYDSVKSDLGLTSIWSIMSVDDLNEPHPYTGVKRVVYQDHWGKIPVSSAVNGLTWAALYMAADACIRDSGDNHHMFIERFDTAKLASEGVLTLTTGS